MKEDGDVSGEVVEKACGMMFISSGNVTLSDFTPFLGRYGCLPTWFPTRDSSDRLLIETAQVDRFLRFLGHVIELPEEHTATDPALLVMGMMELRRAYNDDAFTDWDDGEVRPYLSPLAEWWFS